MTRNLIELIASLFEIWGAVQMANALLGITTGRAKVPTVLLSAIVGGKLARGIARLGGLTQEDYRESLRGLGFVFIGFVLKFCVAIFDMLNVVRTPNTYP